MVDLLIYLQGLGELWYQIQKKKKDYKTAIWNNKTVKIKNYVSIRYKNDEVANHASLPELHQR